MIRRQLTHARIVDTRNNAWHAIEGLTPPEWTDRAVCSQADPEAFFPEKGGTNRHAKALCAVCPVVEQCLTWALETGDQHGIYGGMTARERQLLLKLDRDMGAA